MSPTNPERPESPADPESPESPGHSERPASEPEAQAPARQVKRLPRPTAKNWAAVIAAVLGVWVVVLQVRLTGYALVDIMGGLGVGPDEAGWLNTVSLVAEVIAVPVAVWLSTWLSLRRVFIPAALAFALTSILATRVDSLNQLMLLRVLQGLSGGAFIPLATSVFRRKLPFRQRLVAFALYGMAASVPISLAPLLDALLVERWSWRVVFFPPALLSLVAATLAHIGLPRQPVDRSHLEGFDWLGLVLLPLGLALIILGADQANRLDWFESRWVCGWLLAGVLTLAAFVLGLRRAPRPFVHIGVFSHRNFLIALITFFVFRGSLLAIAWAAPDLMQRVQGFRPEQLVIVFAAMIIPQVVLPFVLLLSSRRLDLRLVIAGGLACQAVACLRATAVSVEWAAPELVPIFALHGIGQGLFFMPLLALLTLDLDPAHRASAVVAVNLTRVLGNALGVASASTFLTQSQHLHSNRLNEYLAVGSQRTAQALARFSDAMIAHGGLSDDRVSLLLAQRALRSQTLVLAYGDLFLGLGIGLLFAVCLQALLRPVTLRELDPRVQLAQSTAKPAAPQSP